MSDVYSGTVLPPIPSNFNNSLDSISSGAPTLSALEGDLGQMGSGTVPGLPGTSSTGTSSPYSLSSIMSQLSGSLTGAGAGTGSTPSATGSGTSSGSTSTSSGLTSFTSDSLIGRVLFFLLGLVFMAGAVYTYKK
jgi:hypothetical protein